MEIHQQRALVKELISNLEREVLSKLDRCPEGWGGRELRKLIHDTAEYTLEGQRLKDYRNECLISNL